MAGRSKFQPRMRGLRLTSVSVPTATMRIVADNVLAKIRERLSQGMDVHDSPAKSLSPGYAKFKTQRMHRQDKRDWYLTGITLGHAKVKSVEPNRAVIGFLPGIRRYSAKSKLGAKTQPIQTRSVPISLVVEKNQRRHRQWGISPSDSQVLTAALQGVNFIKSEKTG